MIYLVYQLALLGSCQPSSKLNCPINRLSDYAADKTVEQQYQAAMERVTNHQVNLV